MMNSDGARVLKVRIDAALVKRLISSQFPKWAGLSVEPVELDGWDNRSFRLGEKMSVRLPSAEPYAAQVEKEQRWLPKLAPLLPLPIPAPLAMGVASANYPWPWSVYGWLEGENANAERIKNWRNFATELGGFLTALQEIDATDGPLPGPHNFFRGGPLTTYDAETRSALALLMDEVDGDAAIDVWEAALAATWRGAAVWLHGDVSASNLLVNAGSLCAVIDFGCSGIGDPACDLTIAWTLFSGVGREAFRKASSGDEAVWARARGWALWKGLITMADDSVSKPAQVEAARRVVTDVIVEFKRAH